MALELTEQDIVNVGPLELKDLGSPAWCWQTVGLLQNLWGSIDDNVTRYAEVWATAEEYRIWEKIPYEAPYGSLVLQRRFDGSQERALGDLFMATCPRA